MSLYRALMTGKYTKARRLIRRRVDINTPGYDGVTDGVTPLMLSASCSDKADITRLLLLAGAEVNACNSFGETTLMIASYSPNNLENVSLLIENGADFSKASVYGYLARDFALYCHSGLYIFESFDDGVTFDRFFPENSVRRAIRKNARAANAAGLEKLGQHPSDGGASRSV
ncbi:MAG: ankyrin repeat domain-containing protein, partial [Deltaproteobacteria bacterium]